jgi:hypothetical protein
MWERDFNGEVANVKMWGAKGDATINPATGVVSGTDDTDAFQRMFRGPIFSGGVDTKAFHEVLIPKGTYKITDSIRIPNDARIRGEHGWQRSMIVMSETNSTSSIFVTEGAARILVGGLTYPGNGDFINGLGQTAGIDLGLYIDGLTLVFAGLAGARSKPSDLQPSASGQRGARTPWL